MKCVYDLAGMTVGAGNGVGVDDELDGMSDIVDCGEYEEEGEEERAKERKGIGWSGEGATGADDADQFFRVPEVFASAYYVATAIIVGRLGPLPAAYQATIRYKSYYYIYM